MTIEFQKTRPLSPHLGIYRWLITNSLSILHRLTGVVLFAGMLVLAWWIILSIYSSFNPKIMMLKCWTSIFGKLFLLGWSMALFYHLLNGIRHLCWDAGYGFSLPAVTRSGIAVLIGTVLLTVISWYIALV